MTVLGEAVDALQELIRYQQNFSAVLLQAHSGLGEENYIQRQLIFEYLDLQVCGDGLHVDVVDGLLGLLPDCQSFRAGRGYALRIQHRRRE